MSAVCFMMEARIAMVCSVSSRRLSGVYSPLRSLMTPGTRTKSTRARKSKLPMMGEPDRIRTVRFPVPPTMACAIARHRLRWPRPKLSWL